MTTILPVTNNYGLLDWISIDDLNLNGLLYNPEAFDILSTNPYVSKYFICYIVI
jgi:hypothetical protein